jgi:hypothetical protein
MDFWNCSFQENSKLNCANLPVLKGMYFRGCSFQENSAQTTDERSVDDLLRDQFLAGLTDENVQDKVSIQRGLFAFSDVVSFARHVEQRCIEQKVRRGERPNAPQVSRRL